MESGPHDIMDKFCEEYNELQFYSFPKIVNDYLKEMDKIENGEFKESMKKQIKELNDRLLFYLTDLANFVGKYKRARKTGVAITNSSTGRMFQFTELIKILAKVIQHPDVRLNTIGKLMNQITPHIRSPKKKHISPMVIRLVKQFDIKLGIWNELCRPIKELIAEETTTYNGPRVMGRPVTFNRPSKRNHPYATKIPRPEGFIDDIPIGEPIPIPNLNLKESRRANKTKKMLTLKKGNLGANYVKQNNTEPRTYVNAFSEEAWESNFNSNRSYNSNHSNESNHSEEPEDLAELPPFYYSREVQNGISMPVLRSSQTGELITHDIYGNPITRRGEHVHKPTSAIQYYPEIYIKNDMMTYTTQIRGVDGTFYNIAEEPWHPVPLNGEEKVIHYDWNGWNPISEATGIPAFNIFPQGESITIYHTPQGYETYLRDYKSGIKPIKREPFHPTVPVGESITVPLEMFDKNYQEIAWRDIRGNSNRNVPNYKSNGSVNLNEINPNVRANSIRRNRRNANAIETPPRTSMNALNVVNLNAQNEVNLNAPNEVNLNAPNEVNLDEVNLNAPNRMTPLGTSLNTPLDTRRRPRGTSLNGPWTRTRSRTRGT